MSSKFCFDFFVESLYLSYNYALCLAPYMIYYLSFTSILGKVKEQNYPHFAKEETEEQRNEVQNALPEAVQVLNKRWCLSLYSRH